MFSSSHAKAGGKNGNCLRYHMIEGYDCIAGFISRRPNTYRNGINNAI